MGNSVVTAISADNRKKNDCGDFAVYSNSITIMIYFSLTFRFMKYSKANEMNFSQVERKVLIFIQISQNSASLRSNHGILPKRNISKGYLKSSKKLCIWLWQGGCQLAEVSGWIKKWAVRWTWMRKLNAKRLSHFLCQDIHISEGQFARNLCNPNECMSSALVLWPAECHSVPAPCARVWQQQMLKPAPAARLPTHTPLNKSASLSGLHLCRPVQLHLLFLVWYSFPLFTINPTPLPKKANVVPKNSSNI